LIGVQHMLKLRLLAAAIFSVVVLFVGASGFTPGPTGEAVLTELENQLAKVKDFVVTLEIVADMERIDVPPMHATLYFKQPDKIHVVSDGFALLPRDGTMLNFARLNERYVATNAGSEEIDGKPCFRLELVSRNTKEFTRKMRLFVDPTRWTAERLETFLPGGRTVTVIFEHTRVEGTWLPAKLTVKMENSAPDSTEELPFERPDPLARRQAQRRGTISITYSDYKLNTGLSDDLFTK
jgi:outer membrane lipoprotein-sorting protein